MEGFVLIGGKSRRMGTDKASIVIGGATMLERAAAVLTSIASDGVRVVGKPQPFPSEYPWIPDPDLNSVDVDRSGPMLGVYAAVQAASSEWIAVLACDLPFVSGELLQLLANIDRTSYDSVVPMQKEGMAQPLCALYRCEPCRSVTERLIKRGELSMRSLIAAIDTRFVPFADLRKLQNAENLFLNVNSPADHERAISILGP